MTPSGATGDSRVTVAPPAAGAAKSRKASYLALAAGGLITATAFAGIADFAVSSYNGGPSAGIQRFERGSSGTDGGGGLIPGNATPDETTIKISGAAHGDDRTTSNDPTTSSGHPTTKTTTSTRPPTTSPERPSTTDPTTKPTKTTTTTTTTTPTTPPCDPEVEECPPPDDGGGDGGGGGSTTSSATSTTDPEPQP